MRGRWRGILVVVVAGVACLACASVASADAALPVCNGQACGTGWYTSPVTLSWNLNGGSNDGGCASQYYWYDVDLSPIPDGQLPAWAFCTVKWSNGTTTSTTTYRLKVEISSPTATAVLGRPPDFNGWYNHPVPVAFQGSSVSGISSCTSAMYGGPDSPAATISGSCTDNAGKTADAISAPFPYDATPPPLYASTDPADGSVTLRWLVAGPLSSFEIARSPGLHGPGASVIDSSDQSTYRDTRVRDGIRYRYTLIARDQAGNASVRTIDATPGPRLLAPASGAAVSTPPRLEWTPVRHATYYNVQLYRGGKILSAWPTRATLPLARSWSFGNRRFRLKPGRYRWYVWPGFGARRSDRYGRLIGTGSFTVIGRA